jgi:hypothetical protein
MPPCSGALRVTVMGWSLSTLTDSAHSLPYPFGTIRSFPAWLIAALQCGAKVCHLSFQVSPDGMHYLIECIIRRGIDVQVEVI